MLDLQACRQFGMWIYGLLAAIEKEGTNERPSFFLFLLPTAIEGGEKYDKWLKNALSYVRTKTIGPI